MEQSIKREMLAICLGKFPFAPVSKLFKLLSVATSVCQCYMNMWNILQSNLPTMMDKAKAMTRQIKQKQ